MPSKTRPTSNCVPLSIKSALVAVKSTVKVVDSPAASVSGAKPLTAKSPVAETPVRSTASLPMFWIVTSCVLRTCSPPLRPLWSMLLKTSDSLYGTASVDCTSSLAPSCATGTTFLTISTTSLASVASGNSSKVTT